MEKLRAVWRVFQLGQSVADPARWKQHQISGNAIAGVLMALVALAAAFGYRLPVSDDQAVAIGGGVVALVNIVLTVVSTDKVGIDGRTHADVAAMAVAAATKAATGPAAQPAVADGRDSPVLPPSRDDGSPGVSVGPTDERSDPFREHGA